jgi:hypothetical protein
MAAMNNSELDNHITATTPADDRHGEEEINSHDEEEDEEEMNEADIEARWVCVLRELLDHGY